jgi:hypothetical protein
MVNNINMDNFNLKKFLTERKLNENVTDLVVTYYKDKDNYSEKGLADGFDIEKGKKVKYIVGYDDEDEMDDIGYIYSKSGADIETDYTEDDLDDAFMNSLNEVKKTLNEEFKRMQKLAGVLNENKINNKYVVKDKEFSDDSGDFYVIDKQKALKYLSQFDNEDIDAGQFISNDEGWGEYEQYLENVEQMSDKEIEDSMRSEMSYYYFSRPDEI